MSKEYYIVKINDSIRDALVLIEVNNKQSFNYRHSIYVLTSNYTPDHNYIRTHTEINIKWLASKYARRITKKEAEFIKLVYIK